VNGLDSQVAALELITAALVILVLAVLLTSILGTIGGSAVDLSMIAGAVVVVGGALALGLSSLADRQR
jgi:hypothetical protein